MSFSSDIKDQLCNNEFECNACIYAELAGILEFAAILKDGVLKIATENENAISRIKSDIYKCFSYTPDVISGTQNKVFQITIDDKTVLKNMSDTLFLFKEHSEYAKKKLFSNKCCIGAYVRGSFIGSGSITNPKKSYHLEFNTRHPGAVDHLKSTLLELGYKTKITYRKGIYIVYVKEYEIIADILGQMGAGLGALELYNIQIEKEVRNTVNRQVNCETANIDKVAKAAVRQIEAIEKIKKHIGFENIPETLHETAIARTEHPDESLKDLAKRLGVGKSGVNHRLNRILDMAKDL